MITAYASLETVKNALTHGAFEYLIKPFSRQDLEETARRALARRQTELGTRNQLAALVNEMRALAAKTRELEEEARAGAGGAVAPRHPAVHPARDLARHPRTARPRRAHRGASPRSSGRAGLRRGRRCAWARRCPRASPARRAIVCPIRDDGDTLGYLVGGQPGGRAAHRPARARAARDAVRLPGRRHPQLAPVRRGGRDQALPRAADPLRGRRHHLGRPRAARSAGWNPAAERIFGSTAAGRHRPPARRASSPGAVPSGRAPALSPASSPVSAFDVTTKRADGAAAEPGRHAVVRCRAATAGSRACSPSCAT